MNRIAFTNNIIVLGYGSIAKAVLPLILDHFSISAEQIKIVAKDVHSTELADTLGITIQETFLTRMNFETVLEDVINAGDLLVNLTAEVSSLDLMRYCSEQGVQYLDTCIELWPDEVDADSKTYNERELLLELKRELQSNSTTVLSSMGANPGIVSLLTKELLLVICKELGLETSKPDSREAWAKLAYDLSVKVIHVNERDTQYSLRTFSETDFVSTWSAKAMIAESIESAEMSIGSHELGIPDGAHYSGTRNKRDIYFAKPGKDVKIKTWLPLAGEQSGMILNHNEPFSIAELYTHVDTIREHSPTVCFVYHPSDHAMTSLRSLTEENFESLNGHILLHDIEGGLDELGVLMMTQHHGAYWLGSRLDIDTARELNPESSATSLQVAGGVIAGMCWIVSNAHEGIVEPEEIVDHKYVLNIAEKYWGGYIFAKTNWTPNSSEDSHQFKHFRTYT